LVPKRMLVKISGHLLSAADRIEVPARRTQGQISRAQGTLEQLLGDLPLKGEILRTYVSTRASAVRSPERLGQRAGRDTGGSRERVAPASTPVYGGPWDWRICRVATLRSASGHFFCEGRVRYDGMTDAAREKTRRRGRRER